MMVLDKRETVNSVLSEIQNTADHLYMHRLHGVLLALQGCSQRQVAEWFNVSPRTVARWIDRFNKAGINGLRFEEHSGRPSKTSTKGAEKIREDVLHSPRHFKYDKDRWDGALLKAHMHSCYGIDLSARQCQRLLRRIALQD